MNKIAIIVPFRNREEHLKKFIPHMISFFQKTDLEPEFLIIEQVDTKPFNRAKLLNVGFNEAKDHHENFCFHDIDLLPVNLDCDYSLKEGVCKLSYYVSQFNFIPRPTGELGGVTTFDKKSYIMVNGYSNEYWGWGVEDNDLGERCRRKKIPFTLRKGRYLSLPHKSNGDTNGGVSSTDTNKNRKYFQNLSNTEDFFESGLSTLTYNKISEENHGMYKKIKVEL